MSIQVKVTCFNSQEKERTNLTPKKGVGWVYKESCSSNTRLVDDLKKMKSMSLRNHSQSCLDS